MSPEAGQMLVEKIAPIIMKTIAKGKVRPFRGEDKEELTADCIAYAARRVHAAGPEGALSSVRLLCAASHEVRSAGHVRA